MKSVKSITLATLVLICYFISVYRITRVSDTEISWDILGYYLYLPATFIYDQPMLNDIAWLEKVNAEKNLTGTLYQVSVCWLKQVTLLKKYSIFMVSMAITLITILQ